MPSKYGFGNTRKKSPVYKKAIYGEAQRNPIKRKMETFPGIDTWRHRNRTTIMYSVYKTSFKCSQMISRIYRILLGEEDLPTSERSVFYNNKSYTDKVYNKAIDDMIKDKDR